MKDFTVIIPSKSAFNLSRCINSFKQTHPNSNGRIVVFDNDISGGVNNLCDRNLVRSIPDYSPFCFSKAINRCASPEISGTDDLILLNDDTEIITPSGFHLLHEAANMTDSYGVVSSLIDGFVGNPQQSAKQHRDARSIFTPIGGIAFICVHIRREVWNALGPLDERLIHYGWDDTLFCVKTWAAGLRLGVYTGCTVKHVHNASQYRNSGPPPDLEANQYIFERIIQEEGLVSHWPLQLKFPLEKEQATIAKESAD